MNTYLYPWHDLKGNNQIGTVYAKSYTDCEERLAKHLIDKYDELDDTLEFDELLNQLEGLKKTLF